MGQRRRIAAYGICREADRVVLVRASPSAAFPGRWRLPGGALRHGEDPVAALLREFAEQTGLAVEVTAVQAVVADVIPLTGLRTAVHTDRVIYTVRRVRGRLRNPADGATDRAGWVPASSWGVLPMMPFTANLLGAPAPHDEGAAAPAPPFDEHAAAPAPPFDEHAAAPAPPAEPGPAARGRRFAAYGLVTDPGGRVLLAQIAAGYPGAGRWHLPGGGTDHGEQPEAALRREIAEESGQLGRVTALLDVSHRHDPAALGPEGHPIDWHVVRAVYRVVVEAPTEPAVTEAAGGSTLRSAWFHPDDLPGLLTTEVAQAALARLALPA